VTYLAPTIVRVSWTTNEPATSEVAYGVSGGPATANAGTTATFALSHDVVLTGLTPETSYTLVVSSRDPDDNGPSSAPPLIVTTPAAPDTTPPVISALRTECITHQAMAVCWDTDEAATANVTFQNVGSGAVSSLTSQTLSLSRCMSVSGLMPSTTYQIAVSSADGGFNVGNAGPLERTTLPDATSGAPVISNLSATYLSETSALVTWQTDVAASTFVRFGEDALAPDRSAGDLTAATTEHSVVLTGLTEGTPVYVTAQSTNPCQQMGASAPLMVVDIDECEAVGVCGANATCDNTVGGFTCRCVAGFERVGEACVDIDECDTAGVCGANSICDNTVGGFTCGCVEGFERVGDVCLDIDECDMAGICGANATCDNTVGGFTCGCVEGFERVGDVCLDVDECDTAGICGANSTCDNTSGGYTCGCLPAYEPGAGGCVLSDPCHFGGPGCNFDTVILGGPADPTAETVATFTFGVVDGTPDAYECRLDGGAWVGCMSPYTTAALADGAHTLLVRSLRRGAYDETPAFYGWTIDTTRPTTTLITAPPVLSGSATAAFAFAANQPVTWRCALDPVVLPPSETEWFECGPAYTTPALSDGEHRLVIRATNTLGLDEVPDLVHVWTVDTTIPATVIEGGPPETLCETTATFVFGSDTGVGFQCRMDDESFAACASPHVREGLSDGLHVLEVFAVDVLDRPDPSPARHPFVVDTTRPTVELVTMPDLVAQSDMATFVFASELGASFECQIGDGPFTSCVSPWVLDSLEDGDQRVAIRALDTCGAGQSIDFGWRIDTRWPDTAFTATPPTVLGREEMASLSFEDPSDTASAFECSLDGADFAACESPLELDGLAVGSHTVAVRACFDAGAGLEVSAVRCDPVPAVFTFEVSASSCPRDTTTPELSCGPGLTVECSGGVGTVSAAELEALTPTVVESCEPSLTSDSPASYPLGTTPIVHSVVDGNGNSASCVTPVHVVDTTAPTLGCPEELAQSAPADRCGVSLSVGAATVEDACDASATVSSDAPAEFEVGATTVTFTARDAAGLTASCTTTVTVLDEAAPTVSCPAVSTTTTGAFTVAPIVADACGVTSTLSELSCALVGGGAASECPVSIAGDRLSVGSERPSLSLTVSVRVDAVDPSGNTTTERCSFVLPAAPAIGPEVDPAIVAGGGAGCASGSVPWHLVMSLVGIGALLRRGRARRPEGPGKA
ncbi:MAG TPA: HYR domain-containing protein, partial [Myxococcota bacterium]|nr:HYR domain-containing protein [Myxococcota bacterium]